MKINANHHIVTDIEPKIFRQDYSRILVQDGEYEVTAETEIFDEGHDHGTNKFFMKIGLHYPRRSTRTAVSLAMQVMKDGKTVAIKRPDYVLTQADFDKVIKGEKITVPTHN